MILSATVRPKLVDTLGVLKLAAGATLLVALSWEILAGDHTLLSPTYLTIQLLVCAVFLCDFFVRLWLSERRGRFFRPASVLSADFGALSEFARLVRGPHDS